MIPGYQCHSLFSGVKLNQLQDSVRSVDVFLPAPPAHFPPPLPPFLSAFPRTPTRCAAPKSRSRASPIPDAPAALSRKRPELPRQFSPPPAPLPGLLHPPRARAKYLSNTP